MPTTPSPDNLRFALELFAAAEELLRRRLQRSGLSAAEIEERVDAWIAQEGEPSSAEGMAGRRVVQRA